MPKYEINEIFYSLKGEGMWTGTPMKFVRLYGCNLNCFFCDTPDERSCDLDENEIIDRLASYPTNCKHVVITGGEPLLQDIYPLRDALVEEGYKVHLETNGTIPIYGHWDWIALSPKSEQVELYNLGKADEVKFLVGMPNWGKIIDDLVHYIDAKRTKLLVMPLAIGQNDVDFSKGSTDLRPDNIKEATEFCLKNPEFSFCCQLHKYLNIK